MSVEWLTCPRCKREHLGRLLLKRSPDSVCTDCVSVDDSGEWMSEYAIRCPHCKDLITEDLWELDVRKEGEIGICCNECGKDFEITTQVTYEFISPALIESESEE